MTRPFYHTLGCVKRANIKDAARTLYERWILSSSTGKLITPKWPVCIGRNRLPIGRSVCSSPQGVRCATRLKRKPLQSDLPVRAGRQITRPLRLNHSPAGSSAAQGSLQCQAQVLCRQSDCKPRLLVLGRKRLVAKCDGRWDPQSPGDDVLDTGAVQVRPLDLVCAYIGPVHLAAHRVQRNAHWEVQLGDEVLDA